MRFPMIARLFCLYFLDISFKVKTFNIPEIFRSFQCLISCLVRGDDDIPEEGRHGQLSESWLKGYAERPWGALNTSTVSMCFRFDYFTYFMLRRAISKSSDFYE